MNTKVAKTYPPMVYKIKEYLEKYCVGKENAKTYNQILDGIYNNVVGCTVDEEDRISHMAFKVYIRTIRKAFDRYVCSNKHGYYLPTNEEELNGFLVKQAITHMKTCLSQGVSKDVFYKVLKETPCNNVLDGQQKLKVTPYAKEEVTRITRG